MLRAEWLTEKITTSHLAKLHSLAVDKQAGRLWFTMPHDVPLPLDPDPSSESTIGYVDLESWRRQIANPDSSSPIRGVLYSGFGPLMPDEMQQETRYAFAGIAVDPNSGRIALATAWRRQVTELRPHSGFWP